MICSRFVAARKPKCFTLLQYIVFLRLLTIVCGYKGDAYLENFCKSQIDPSYEVHEPPKNEDEPGQPIDVFVKFKVIDIDEIDGAHMDFRLHMYVKLFWKDARLKRNTTMTTDCSSYVWTPDILFETAKEIHSFETVSTAFRVDTTGHVIMSDRYSFKASCIMNFRHYPFDTQDCLFTVVFMKTIDEVAQLKWLDKETGPFPGEPIEFDRAIEPLQYYLVDHPTTHSVTKQLTYGKSVNANYTYLVANFTLVRRLTGSIVNIYVPSTLVVAVSWITFWLRPEAAPARVSLSITSLLTLCTQVQQYKAQLPSVNYITAMDIWLFVCIFEVFSTLLEFAVCYNAYVSDKEKQKLKLKKVKENDQPKSLSSSQEAKINWLTEDQKDRVGKRLKEAIFGQRGKKWCISSMCLKDSLKMDAFCRKYFPLSFLAFAVVYWSYFLHTKKEEMED